MREHVWNLSALVDFSFLDKLNSFYLFIFLSYMCLWTILSKQDRTQYSGWNLFNYLFCRELRTWGLLYLLWFVIFNTIQGWTLYEILRYAPQHNWSAYEEALKTNPVLAKMMISGIVYSLGDWIAQVNFCVIHACTVLLQFSEKNKGYNALWFNYSWFCSALKENLCLSLTVHGCSDRGLLVLLFMVLFLISIISFAR